MPTSGLACIHLHPLQSPMHVVPTMAYSLDSVNVYATSARLSMHGGHGDTCKVSKHEI